MKRPPYHEQPPKPDEVRAAREKARPGSSSYLRQFGLSQRAFFQGVVSEHLRQEAERAKGSKAYRAPTAAEKRAFELTRAWLEFGDCLDDYESKA